MSVAYKLEPFDINELKRIRRGGCPYRSVKRNILNLLEEFSASENDCCRICVCEDGRIAHMECCIIRRSIKIGDFTNIKVVIRGVSVYLVKKDKWEV